MVVSLNMYKIAYKYDDNVVFYFDPVGNKYIASGGSLAWRINNPGLVRSRSHVSYKNGGIGNYEGYAIFPDAACGRKALVAWLHSKKYFDSSLQTLGKHYNPKDPEKFVDQLTAIAKLPSNCKVGSLNKEEFGQVIWGFINGIDNTEAYARKSATLISDAADGEQVLSMPNDTICKAVDLAVCGALKIGIDTPLVQWTVQFLRYLLIQAEKSKKFVVVFAHSQGAIYLEHALELMNPQERKLLRIFTFGGGSYIESVKCHPDSHNYASAADFVCRFVSPNYQWLALQRYYGHKDGLNDAQVIHKLAFEDATLHLDTTDVKVWEIFIKKRERHYEQEFSKINHITILDPDPDSNWKHEFISNCYQVKIKERIDTFKGM